MNKNRYLILIIFIIQSNFLFADLGILPIGMGIDISKDVSDIYFDLTFYRIECDYSTGIGFGTSIGWIGFGWDVIRYYYHISNVYYERQDYFEEKHSCSIINPIIFWNIFPSSNLLSFGPIINLNYAPNFDFKSFIFSTGIRLTYYVHGFFANYIRFHIEVGHRYMSNIDRNSFYFVIKFGPLSIFR